LPACRMAVLVDRRFRMKTNPESQDRSLSPATSGWELYPLPPWHDTDPEETPVRGLVDSDEEATHLISDAQTKAAEHKPQRTNNTEFRTAAKQQTEHNPQPTNNTELRTAAKQQTEHNPQPTNNTELRTAPEQQTHPPVRPRRRWSIVVGILTFVAVALLGSFVAAARPITYEAVTTVVVVPSKNMTVLEAAGLYDTLSRGQVVATAAEVFQQERWRRDAPGVTVTAGSITPSAVIKVAASGSTPSQVVDVLNDVMWKATPEANRLLDPYKVVRLDTTPPHAEPIGLTRPVLYCMVALASLFAGAFMYRVWPRAVKWVRRPR
jgi:capsular polysaccharide biosynthesis protein